MARIASMATASFTIVKVPLPTELSMQGSIKTVSGESNQLKCLLGLSNQNPISRIDRTADLSVNDEHDT